MKPLNPFSSIHNAAATGAPFLNKNQNKLIGSTAVPLEKKREVLSRAINAGITKIKNFRTTPKRKSDIKNQYHLKDIRKADKEFQDKVLFSFKC